MNWLKIGNWEDLKITLTVYHHVNVESIRRMHAEFSPLTELNNI